MFFLISIGVAHYTFFQLNKMISGQKTKDDTALDIKACEHS
jgi:hypothetical protein